MSNSDYKNIGDDIILFHKLITRSLEVAIQSVNKFLEDKTLIKSSDEGFINYMQSFSSVLEMHHLHENEKLFPYFKDKLPDVPYERLMLQHKTVKVLTSGINEGISKLKSKSSDLSSLNLLKSNLGRINLMWPHHIEIEETEIFGNVGKLDISSEELDKLRFEFYPFIEEHNEPAYLIMPFIIYNLYPEDRAILAQVFPDEVTKQLIPIDWKEKWVSMQPFLLK